MFKLLIVDDEPLVQVGVKSMINWSEYGIEIIGCVSNGKQALDIIKKDTLDIVISDIKMPVMDGLELAKYCSENLDYPPVFIILTSYEEFELAKKAIKYNVIDYLIKLELNKEMLEESIKKSLSKLKKRNADKEIVEKVRETDSAYNEDLINQNFRDKFFIKLLYNLFENDDMFEMQLKNLNLNLSGYSYVTCFCEINCASEKSLNQYICTLNMFKEIAIKYLKCFILSLDYNHFAVICFLDTHHDSNEVLSSSLNKICTMINKYYNVQIKIGVGNIYDSLHLINVSFEEGRSCYNSSHDKHNIVFYSQFKKLSSSLDDTFNLSLYKDEFIKAFEEYDTKSLYNILSKIIDNLNHHLDDYIQSLDCACDILYVCINLLNDGKDCINKIFEGQVDGYKSIYQTKNVEQIVKWLVYLRDRLCEYMDTKKKNYTNNTIIHVKKYIKDHTNEKLSLNEVANVYSISPSYLSTLFKKYCNIGFTEYVTQSKIEKAKDLLLNENYKVYEISEMLGFESAFYFSKVFKKVTGISPKEYTKLQ